MSSLLEFVNGGSKGAMKMIMNEDVLDDEIVEAFECKSLRKFKMKNTEFATSYYS